MTETAVLADVVLPAANLYEKSGSVTNHYGDLQQVKKAADHAGVRSDFEMIVRIADKHGRTHAVPHPLRQRLAARTWARPAAHSPAKPTATPSGSPPHNMEPRLSPFDPLAILDEIQRLVPGYDKLLRLQLLSGNDQHLEPAAQQFVQIEPRRDLVLPSGDTLFTSGTLGHYSAPCSSTCNPTRAENYDVLNQTAAD